MSNKDKYTYWEMVSQQGQSPKGRIIETFYLRTAKKHSIDIEYVREWLITNQLLRFVTIPPGAPNILENPTFVLNLLSERLVFRTNKLLTGYSYLRPISETEYEDILFGDHNKYNAIVKAISNNKSLEEIHNILIYDKEEEDTMTAKPNYTLTLDKETHDFLLELSKRMNEQDNRGTASPFGFIIAFEEDNPVPDDMADGYKYIYEETEFDEDDLPNLYIGYVDTCIDAGEIPVTKDEFIKTHVTAIPYATKYHATHWKCSNYFLTEEAGKEHIARNKHNLPKNPHLFGIYNNRNSEMEKLQDFLRSLTK